MPENTRPSSRARCFCRRLSSTLNAFLPENNLSSLGAWAVLMLLFGLLMLFIVREIRDGTLTSCPGYDGVTHRREAEVLCATP